MVQTSGVNAASFSLGTCQRLVRSSRSGPVHVSVGVVKTGKLTADDAMIT